MPTNPTNREHDFTAKRRTQQNAQSLSHLTVKVELGATGKAKVTAASNTTDIHEAVKLLVALSGWLATEVKILLRDHGSALAPEMHAALRGVAQSNAGKLAENLVGRAMDKLRSSLF